jgi:methylglyoxal synthase
MTTPLRNADVAAVLREIALFLSMEDEPFKPRAYEKAAQSIDVAEESCAVLFAAGGVKALATIPGIGKSIAEKIGELLATGTTGTLIMEACPQLEIVLMKSGPLGGDQQVGALLAQGEIDILIFFIYPLSPHPHEADIRALTRLSTLYHVATATNRATADFLITSPFFDATYSQAREDSPTGI